MGEKTGHIIWNKLDRLNVTPTEALVLLALAHFGIDDLPLCHPRQRHICRKTHLSMTAVKTSLAALKKKRTDHHRRLRFTPKQLLIQILARTKGRQPRS